MMKFNKDKFMKTKIGSGMEECIAAWDEALDNQLEYPYGTIPHEDAEKRTYWCQAQWEVYKMILRQLYGMEFHFTRTDEYFGIVTEDETVWLMKVKRI